MSTSPAERAARRSHHGLGVQVLDLFLMELSNWRWSWRLLLLQGLVTPLFSLGAMGFYARDSGQEALVYVATGNIVVSLLFGTMHSLQSRLSWMRFQGGLDYVATLPVQRYAVVLAVMAAFLVLSLPSVAVVMVVGSVGLGIPLRLHPLLLLVIPCCSAPLAGVGAALGLAGRSPQESNALSFLLSLLMTALGPVVVPPGRLPALLTALGRLSPATYAASALRQVLVGPVTLTLALDLAVLLAVTVLSLAWVVRMMSHRRD